MSCCSMTDVEVDGGGRHHSVMLIFWVICKSVNDCGSVAAKLTIDDVVAMSEQPLIEPSSIQVKWSTVPTSAG